MSAGDEDRKAPGMSTGKRRGRGDGMGAENGGMRPGTVRSDAVDRGGVEYTQAAWTWRLGVWGIGEGLHEQRRQGMAAFGVLSFLLLRQLARPYLNA